MSSRVSVGMVMGCTAPMGLERASSRLYRLMGVDSLFLPDHYLGFVPRSLWGPELTPAAAHVPSPHAYLDPFVMLGAMAADGGRARLGTGVTEPFRRHPATLAQAFVTLDHLTKGRAILGVGSGERENTEPYGMPFVNRVSRLEEALTIVRLLWESGGEPVDFDGKIWKLRDALFTTPLYQGKPPPVWVAAHGPRMLALTGRFGDGWFPTQKLTPQQYAAGLAQIHSAATEAGRSMDHFEPAIQVLVALGPNREAAIEGLLKVPLSASMALLLPGALWARHGLDHPMGPRFEGFSDFVPESVTPEQIEASRRAVTPELIADGIFAGNVDDVVSEIGEVVGAGARHVAIWNIGPLATGLGVASIAQLAMLVRRLKKLRIAEKPLVAGRFAAEPSALPAETEPVAA